MGKTASTATVPVGAVCCVQAGMEGSQTSAAFAEAAATQAGGEMHHTWEQAQPKCSPHEAGQHVAEGEHCWEAGGTSQHGEKPTIRARLPFFLRKHWLFAEEVA